MTIRGIVWFGVALCGVAWGQDAQVAGAASAESELLQIDRIRQERNAEFNAQEEACQPRFATNDCLRAVRAQRNALQADLKRQEIRINDQRRLQRGVEQRRLHEEKAAERAQLEADTASSVDMGAQDEKKRAHDEKVRNNAHQKLQGVPAVRAEKPQSASNPAAMDESRRAYAKKQDDALKRRLDLEKRLKEQGPASPTLPVPQ